VRKRIEADIKRKVEGQDIAVSGPEPEPAPIIDLMEALKASLGKSKGGASTSASGSTADGDASDRKPARRSEDKAEPKKKAAKR
jgi:non-homologous end joining protein Ku